MPRTALIGGSGLYSVPGCALQEKRRVSTRYGEATVFTYLGPQGGEFAFLPRHGEGHTSPPHKINYRANVMALKQCGVERIIAVASVGSLREGIRPGDFVLLDQFLDFTRARPFTFYDEGPVVHTDVTEPFCAEVRSCVLGMPLEGVTVHPGGTYVCAEGPRFETAAEIRMFAMLGGDVVGMTLVPEVVLARELGMCYAGLAAVTNYAAGISTERVSHVEVLAAMKKIEGTLASYVVGCLEKVPEKRGCGCGAVPGPV
jgi:5'-methylthioadenosine phosphorylase